MSVTITMPENIESHLEAEWGKDLPRRALEALAVEGYRTGALSLGEVAEMLELSINDADGFLKSRAITAIETLEEIESDSRMLEELLAK